MEKKKTAGQISMDLFEKEPEITDVREARVEFEKDYVKKVEDTIQKDLHKYNSDFYVVVETKQERLMKNILRNFIFTRETCPTPHYDQIVYKYHKKTDTIAFLWVVPNKNVCMDMHMYPLEVPEEMHGLRDFVFDFYDDVLLRKCKKLNKETVETKGFYD